MNTSEMVMRCECQSVNENGRYEFEEHCRMEDWMM